MPPKKASKRSLEATDPSAGPAAKRASPARVLENTSASASSSAPCPLTFLTQPRPRFDFLLENDIDEDKEGAQKAWDELRATVPKYRNKPAADFPDYPWKRSTKCRKLDNRYSIQVQKRDQDMFGCYFYNDFTGYGMQEVIENMLMEWKKEYSKKDASPWLLWASVEQLGFFFNESDMGL